MRLNYYNTFGLSSNAETVCGLYKQGQTVQIFLDMTLAHSSSNFAAKNAIAANSR
jgi:hypothetical protein